MKRKPGNPTRDESERIQSAYPRLSPQDWLAYMGAPQRPTSPVPSMHAHPACVPAGGNFPEKRRAASVHGAERRLA